MGGYSASLCADVTGGFEVSIEQLQKWVKAAILLYMGKSPWPVLGLKGGCGSNWAEFCLFHTGDTHGPRAGTDWSSWGEEFSGVIISDDYSVYNSYPYAAEMSGSS